MTSVALGPPSSPRGLHPLLSVLVFLPLVYFAAALGGAVPLGVWAVLNWDQVFEVVRAGDPTAFTALLAGNGDLMLVCAATAAPPVFGVVALARRYFDRKPVLGLGLEFRAGHLLAGLGAAALAVAVLFGALVVSGQLRVDGLVPDLGASALRVFSLLLVVFLQSGTEELVCRGYLQTTLLAYFRPAVAVLLVSVLFGALHLTNPNASVMSFAQTTLIGVLFSQVTLRTGGLWAAIGLHTGWNYALGSLASLPLSGMRVSHLLEVRDVGSSWLTGGSYGLEASALNLAVVAAACLSLWKTLRGGPPARELSSAEGRQAAPGMSALPPDGERQ